EAPWGARRPAGPLVGRTSSLRARVGRGAAKPRARGRRAARKRDGGRHELGRLPRGTAHGRRCPGIGASPAAVFVVNAGMFVFSAVLVAGIRRPFGRGSTEEHPGVLAGLGVIVREPALRVPVLAGMVSLIGVGIVNVASYPLSLKLHGGTAGYGGMTALLGGGGVRGARRRDRLGPQPGLCRAGLRSPR